MNNFVFNGRKVLKVNRFCDLSAEPLLTCEKRKYGIFKMFKEKKTYVMRKWDKKRIIKYLCALLPAFIFTILVTGTCISLNEKKPLSLGNIESSEVLAFYKKDADELDKELILINEKNKLNKEYNFNIVSYNGIKCEKMIIPYLDQMLSDAKKEGYELKVVKGFVDQKTQDLAYEEEVNKIVNSGCTLIRAEAIAKKKVSPADSCEYTTGLIVEIVPQGTEKDCLRGSKWMDSHCAKYGFIQRFPKGKEDKTGKEFNKLAYRYVGQKHAKQMQTLGVCLEEYLGNHRF